MFSEQTFIINSDYKIVRTYTPDTNVIRVRALETETVQTTDITFYLLDNDNRVVELLSLDTNTKEEITESINNIISNEIDKANIILMAYGINIKNVIYVSYPHEEMNMEEVPSISTYETLFERETITYLKNCNMLANAFFEEKDYIDKKIKILKDLDFWNDIDVFTILCHKSNWDPLTVNVNLKTDVPKAWRNLYPGVNGGLQNRTGYLLDGSSPGVFINLGFFPSADDFANFYPNCNFSRNNASITVKIADSVGDGGILTREVAQDILYYDAANERLYVNITGGHAFIDAPWITYTGTLDGVWTLNRYNDPNNFDVWKDGVKIATVPSVSQEPQPSDYYKTAGYLALGYSSAWSYALTTKYQMVMVGAALNDADIGIIKNFMDSYVSGFPV